MATSLTQVYVGQHVKYPTHDVKLTDVNGNMVGLVLCNRQGKLDSGAMQIASMPRTALQTTQGNTGYDDMELPFVAEVQNSWVGGRGSNDFGRDRSKYYDGHRIDTTKEFAICGPKSDPQTGLDTTYINYFPTNPNLYPFWFTEESSRTGDEAGYFKMYTGTSSIIVIGIEIKLWVLYNNTTINYGPATIGGSGVVTTDYSITLNKMDHAGYVFLPFETGSGHPTQMQGGKYYLNFNMSSDKHVQWFRNPDQTDCARMQWDGDSYEIMNDRQGDPLDCALDCKIYTVANTEFESKLFEYKNQLYLIQNKYNGTAPLLYMNGYRGQALSNSTNKWNINTGLDLTGVDLTGCIALIIDGPGEQETQPWRKITSNTSYGACRVSTPWKITHTVATSFVILDTNKWTLITGHGLTKNVTDICVTNEFVTFCQGDEAPIRFMAEFYDSGASPTWHREFADQTANDWDYITKDNTTDLPVKADFMKLVQLETGEMAVWRARADDSMVDYSFINSWTKDTTTQTLFEFDINKRARQDLLLQMDRINKDYDDEAAKPTEEQDTGYLVSLTRMALDIEYQINYHLTEVETGGDGETGTGKPGTIYGWGTHTVAVGHKFLPYYITCGNLDNNITGLIMYGQPKIPYVFKEDSIGSIYNNIYAELPIPEMKAVRSRINGKANMQFGVYLYYGLEGGLIERYYDQRIDNVGPTLGEGLPRIRSGEVTKMLQYPGRFYISIDAGKNGYSSVLCNNETGWHEIYRSNAIGQSITDIYVQSICGFDNADRLWIAMETSVSSIPIAINPLTQTNYKYYGYRAGSGQRPSLETGWIDFDMKDVNKYFHSVTIFSDYPNGTVTSYNEYFIYVYYKVDNQSDWKLAGRGDAHPIQEIILDREHKQAGRKIKLKIELQPWKAELYTPQLRAIIVNGVLRMPVKQSWSITFLLEPMKDLQDKPMTDASSLIYNRLCTWANSKTCATPLVMNTNDAVTDGKIVFIDPASIDTFQAVSQMGTGSGNKEYRHLASCVLYEV